MLQADTGSCDIKRVSFTNTGSALTNVVATTVAGNGDCYYFDGVGSEASFAAPTGVALINDQTLLVVRFACAGTRLREWGSVS